MINIAKLVHILENGLRGLARPGHVMKHAHATMIAHTQVNEIVMASHDLLQDQARKRMQRGLAFSVPAVQVCAMLDKKSRDVVVFS